MAEYIDRELLKRAVHASDLVNREKMALLACVSSIPASDVAPVRHGRWDGGTCTHCKLPWDYNMVQNADDWGYMDPMPNFCPNCGAKMDGEAP